MKVYRVRLEDLTDEIIFVQINIDLHFFFNYIIYSHLRYTHDMKKKYFNLIQNGQFVNLIMKTILTVKTFTRVE